MLKRSPSAGADREKKRKIIMLSAAGVLLVVAGVLYVVRSDRTPGASDQSVADTDKVAETIRQKQAPVVEPPPIPESERGKRRIAKPAGS